MERSSVVAAQSASSSMTSPSRSAVSDVSSASKAFRVDQSQRRCPSHRRPEPRLEHGKLLLQLVAGVEQLLGRCEAGLERLLERLIGAGPAGLLQLGQDPIRIECRRHTVDPGGLGRRPPDRQHARVDPFTELGQPRPQRPLPCSRHQVLELHTRCRGLVDRRPVLAR
jgi:hypothetical protein